MHELFIATYVHYTLVIPWPCQVHILTTQNVIFSISALCISIHKLYVSAVRVKGFIL